MAKYFAYQVPPEEQESPLSFHEIGTDYINLTGNRDYTERVSLLFGNVRDALYNGDILDEWDGIRNRGRSLYYTWADALRDIIPPSGRGGEYTRAERLRIPEIAREYYYGAGENKSICELLSIVTGQPWECTTLRGCCQSDWQYAFYPANAWNRAQLDDFETEYFNTGTEWRICDAEEPDDAAEYVYTHAWNVDAQRQEIADAIGREPEEIEMFRFSGYTRTACYKEVIL